MCNHSKGHFDIAGYTASIQLGVTSLFGTAGSIERYQGFVHCPPFSPQERKWRLREGEVSCPRPYIPKQSRVEFEFRLKYSV